MRSVESASTSAGASPLVRIRSLLPGLAKAEQRVARVVLDDPATISHRSITE
ncbi:MAG: RpiR family transcriptional regulator, partial [Kutzneria sp.]|nr:RpiR family transcriptional regulator [Kutzneria sp.]